MLNCQTKKLMYDFAKEMRFNLKAQGNKSTRDRTLIKKLKSPGLIVSASGVSKTIFLSSNPDELCDRLKLLLQEKHAGNISDIINDEIVAIVDKLLEYKCISKNNISKIELYVICYKIHSYNRTNLLKTVIFTKEYNYSNKSMYTHYKYSDKSMYACLFYFINV